MAREPRIPKAAIEQYFGRTQEVAAGLLGVSISTLKRYCRHYGIASWPNSRASRHSTVTSAKATYGTAVVEFNISSDIELEGLLRMLGNHFRLEVGSFRIEYEDEDGEWITITDTDDLKMAMDSAGENLLNLLLPDLRPACFSEAI